MEAPKLSINGIEYNFLKRRNTIPVSIYKGQNSFLRVGPKALIQKEIAYHKNLFQYGFPVATITEEGQYEDFDYYIEESLGDSLYSDIFKANLEADYMVSDSDFKTFLTVIEKFATAQLNTTSTATQFDTKMFEDLIQADVIQTELPYLKEKTRVALNRVENRIKDLPMVLTHGDLNPHNTVLGGVIDWERGTYAPLGYDVVSNIFTIFFFPLHGDFEFAGGYQFSRKQIVIYSEMLSTLYTSNDIQNIFSYTNEFILSRCIWAVVRMDRWPKIQKWRNIQYEKLLNAYLDGESLTDLLLNYQRDHK